MSRFASSSEAASGFAPHPAPRPGSRIGGGKTFLTLLAPVSVLLLFGLASGLSAQDGCTDCHEALADNSVHSALGCTDCHEGMTEYPHDVGELSPSCSMCHEDIDEATGEGVHADFFEHECSSCHAEAHEIVPVEQFRLTVDDLCGECHDDARSAVLASAHQDVSRGMAPVCSDCHGAHGILRADNPEAPTYHLNVEVTCSRCHGNEELMLQADLERVAPAYHDSIHGFAVEQAGLLVAPTCVTCHGAHDILPHGNPESRVARGNVMENCGECHAGVFKDYQDSIHAEVVMADGNAPICIDCHSAHGIEVTTDQWALDVIEECGTCHREMFDTYRRDFHGQVTALDYGRAAKCSDCHGAHDIVRTEDPSSPVGEGRLLATCRECHPNAAASYADYNPHPDPSDPSDVPIYWSTRLMVWLLIGVFSFFGVHTLLWLPRSYQERQRRKRRHGDTGEKAT